MPRPSSALRPRSFVVRLVSMVVTTTLAVPLGNAHGSLADLEFSSHRAFAAPPASEPPSPPMPAFPQPPGSPPPPLPQASIARCPEFASTQGDQPRNRPADEWGEITVAQPKIWQFERMSALLDGLLRDVEGVSLNDLTQLNPNAQNAAAVRFVQSALEVGVQYDQANAVNAQNILANYQAIHNSQLQQLDSYNAYMKTLTAERDRLAAQYMAATNEVNALNALKAAGPLSPAQQKQLDEATSRQASAQSSLTSVNSLISGAGTAPTLTPPTNVTGTSVQQPASTSTLTGFAEVLKDLPQGLQDNLGAALKSPTFPATKQLDNFITLLYERLAREISVLQDDLTRDPENEAFLLQFDVGLYPSKKAGDHVARVEFDLDCPGCKVYSLYPGQSAYNLANYSGASKRNSFWGNIATLFGLGLSASYRRQVDTLEGSLVQSVYTAGFLNGVLNGPTGANQSARQSFGWYYGPAPFEKLVTPGIRSTFALISVPREEVERFTDRFGNVDACVVLQINGAWASRNDPLAQDYYESILGYVPHEVSRLAYDPKRDELFAGSANCPPVTPTKDQTSCFRPSVLRKETLLKLPASTDDVPLVARREKQKLHVVRMEYNTVYQSTDSPGLTMVSTSSAAAPGSSTSNTTVTASAASPTVTPAPSASPVTNNPYDVLPCPKGECAGMLLRLDRPVDPNLVITVNGKPLKRVRDWRGRATSILPPAQSGSDLSGQAAASGSLNLRQLKTDRSLLESDQFEPNSWFPVSSHDIILNISKELTTEPEFPVIRLTDAAGTTMIPYDLRQNVTELTINGFHLKPKTDNEIINETLRNLRVDTGLFPERDKSKILSFGPYPYSTFVPLFSDEPIAKQLYAYVGETGEDLLIGFLNGGAGQCPGTEESRCVSLLETHTQVILEDRNLDFAWSLSCVVQGNQLACELPRTAIGEAYKAAKLACSSKERLDRTLCPSYPLTASEEYTNGLQVWVEQSDPQAKDDFYSPQPASLGLFYWADPPYEHHDYRPWHFRIANDKRFQVEACSYIVDNKNQPLDNFEGQKVTVLSSPNYPILEPGVYKSDSRCAYFSVDTPYLLEPQLAFRLDKIDATITVPAERLRPGFSRPQIYRTGSAATESWQIDFQTHRTVCSDLDSLTKQLAGTSIAANWWDGISEVKACPNEGTWSEHDRNSQIHLKLNIPKSQLGFLPQQLELIRGGIQVATLPSLRKLLFPSRLKLDALSDSQFVLSGEHAGIMDAVLVSNGTFSQTFKVASSGDFALVTAQVRNPNYKPAKPAAQSAPNAQKPTTQQQPEQRQQQPAQQPQNSPQQPKQNAQPPKPAKASFRIGTLKQKTRPRLLVAAYRLQQNPPQPGQSQSSPAQANKPPAKPAPKPAPKPSPKPSQNPSTPQTQERPEPEFLPLDPGTYRVVPLVGIDTDPKVKEPKYIPLTVANEEGKALIFTVPSPKKPDTSKEDKGSTPPACAVPCVLAPCAATCPPASKPAATTP